MPLLSYLLSSESFWKLFATKMADNRSLQGRVAIVTGASRGIGRAIAIDLARKGAKLVVNYVGNVEKAEEVASIINSDSEDSTSVLRAITGKADVSKASEVSSLFDKAEEAFGKNAHILVNCAAVLDAKFPFLVETSEQSWDWTFDINSKGAFLCCREAANRLVKGGGGRIINITSSIVGILEPGYAAYAASKAAVETMTKILARELRGTNITANCVAPGSVATDMFFENRSEAVIEIIAKGCPMERIGEVDDVASLVTFLASDEGEWVDAQVIRVNGGYV